MAIAATHVGLCNVKIIALSSPFIILQLGVKSCSWQGSTPLRVAKVRPLTLPASTPMPYLRIPTNFGAHRTSGIWWIRTNPANNRKIFSPLKYIADMSNFPAKSEHEIDEVIKKIQSKLGIRWKNRHSREGGNPGCWFCWILLLAKTIFLNKSAHPLDSAA